MAIGITFTGGASKGGSSSTDSSNMVSNTSLSSSIGTYGNGIVIYEKITDENNKLIRFDRMSESDILGTLNSRLNSTGIYTGDYDDFLYLRGDYSHSHFKAQYMKANQKSMCYSLLLYNCADAVCDVLIADFNPNSELYQIFKDIRDHHIHPGVMHDRLKDLLK